MILCCGEALIDMIPPENGVGFVPHVGGAVLNTAVALGRLSIPVEMLTGLSSDQFGRMIESRLADSNVSAAPSVRSTRLTTLAMVELKDKHATYSFYDQGSALRMIGDADMPKPDHIDAEAVFFGGISLCNGPVADSFAKFAAALAPSKTVMLDPNLRPGFAEDEAAYRTRLLAMIESADIIKVSDDDLDLLITGSIPMAEKVDRLMADGPQVMILTKGAEGAEAIHRNGTRVSVAAQRADVVDTVGAGDTFNAGFLAALSRGGVLAKSAIPTLGAEQLEDALSLGAKAAAVTVSRSGANPPWAREIGLS